MIEEFTEGVNKRNGLFFLSPRPNDYVTITASSRASCTGGGTTATGGGTTATGGGSRATGSGTGPTGCIRPAAGPYTVSNSSGQRHPGFNPNIPPSYDQAVAGKCKLAKLEEGLAEAQGPVAMETVALDDSPPVYTPVSMSTSEFPLASPTPPPIYSSHVSDDSKMDDGDPNKIAVIRTK